MMMRLITAGVLALMISTALAIPPVGPGGQGRLAEPYEVRLFDVGDAYRLTYGTNMTLPMMGGGGEVTMTFLLSLSVAGAEDAAGDVITMTLDRLIMRYTVDGMDEVQDTDDPNAEEDMRAVIGMSFVGRIDSEGQVTDFAVTEEGRQAMMQANMGEMDEVFVATFEGMLVDCMYYAPGPEVQAGDTWELSRDTSPGFSNYLLLMMGPNQQVTATDETACTLASLGGDGTPTVVTFVGSRRLGGSVEMAPIELAQLTMATTGRAEFDPGAEVPLTLVRQTTMALPAEMAPGVAGMEMVTTERITLTPPGVDAPAPAEDEAESLPAHPGIEGEPPTQPAADEPTTQPATLVETIIAE